MKALLCPLLQSALLHRLTESRSVPSSFVRPFLCDQRSLAASHGKQAARAPNRTLGLKSLRQKDQIDKPQVLFPKKTVNTDIQTLVTPKLSPLAPNHTKIKVATL